MVTHSFEDEAKNYWDNFKIPLARQLCSDYLNKVKLKKTTLNIRLYATMTEENYLEMKTLRPCSH